MKSDRMPKPDERLRMSSVWAGGRVVVPVVGEVDHLTSARLGSELDTAVTSGAQCIEVDFRRVKFCDCSGVNALLGARRTALEAGACLHLSGPLEPVVARLLQVMEAESSLLTAA
ncbi:STAS domain-containing protein [Streptomyces sp. A5-4]|uniref:STAS domain-containing protein n=1 Tax=Streptomyces sp. A5-4 TaxID=3384771 RepID=UPI003DA821FF